jgi:hypothetical protein
MAKTAERTDPKLWEEVKAEVKQGSKGGEAGEWSASKARLAVQEYKKRGGRYRGKTGGDADARYQPQDVRTAARPGEEYRAEAEAKSEAGGQSEQVARRRDAIAIAAARHHGGRTPAAAPNKADLLRQAKMLEIEGRSRMTKEDLAKAIRYAKH